ncbi:hypothetical protein E4U54_008039, partial [Claviceps lovelessii]
ATYNKNHGNQEQNVYKYDEKSPRWQFKASDIVANFDGTLDGEMHGGETVLPGKMREWLRRKDMKK